MTHTTFFNPYSKTYPADSQIYKEILDVREVVVENSNTVNEGCRPGYNKKYLKGNVSC